ncbi:hypothetical protein SESBI_37243 [Sesbania bispinosa]|nr:hypothetical protein SESBI_37243 [Sesbania bispinosa]
MALVNGPIDMVRNICGVKDSWRLKVRVVRLWKSCSKNDPKKVFSLEMVLVDAEGARIQASIRKPMIRKFADVVVEGEVYKMIHFAVVKNLGNFRATKHEFKLIFNSRTTVFRAESQLIPEFGLSLSSSEDIRKTKGESEYLYDGKTTRLIVLELTDDKGKIRCTLFGDYVDKVNEFLSLSGTQLTVVVIQFARVNTYKGEVGLVNVFNTSRLLWNPQIVEAIDFRKSVACHEVDSDICIGFLDDDIQSLSMKDEFLNSFPRKNLEELQTCEEDGFFVVLATVLSIIDDHWWYSACSCNRSVTTDDEGQNYCTNCATYVSQVTPRYKLKLLVCDCFETATFILFDSHCRYLLNKSCEEMLSISKVESSPTFPDELKQIVGKEILFKVQKNADVSFFYDDDAYKVKKICDDTEIIEEFKTDGSIVTPKKV